MSRFKCVVTLKQITPMIHFQYGDYGACLRASDVKPRLDNYILNKEFGPKGRFKNKEDYDKGLKNFKAEHNGWFIKPEDENVHALNYRMTISVGDNPNVEITTYRSDAISNIIKKLNESEKGDAAKFVREIEEQKRQYKRTIKNPKSYFGNMVSGSGLDKCENVMEQYKEGILYKSEITLTILAMNTELLSRVKDHISNFFLINNFGTRADKGLGGFYVSKIDGMEQPMPNDEIIHEAMGKPVYKVNYRYSEQSLDQVLDDIRTIYSLMKGGYNFGTDYFKGYIFRYFFSDSNIPNNPNGRYYSKGGGEKINGKVPRNDKAFMKRTIFDKGLDRNDRSEDKNWDESQYNNFEYHYVRAFLGVPDSILFRDEKRKGEICIEATDSGDINRVPSPLVFKVLPGIDPKNGSIIQHIYLLPGDVDPRIIGAEFKFWLKKKNVTQVEESDKLSIFTPKTFNLMDFLDGFMFDFNDKKSLKCGDHGLIKAQNRDFNRIKNDYYRIKKITLGKKEDKPT